MIEIGRRHSDAKSTGSKLRISRLAFLLAGILIALTSASLLFVGFVASKASEKQAIANEERLLRNTAADRMRALVREQITVTYSDQSVESLVRDLDPAFVRTKFDELWSAYGHSKVMLITGERKVAAESFRDYTHITQQRLSEVPELEAIYDKLRGLYRRNRVRVPNGFGHRSLQGIDPSVYAVMGYAVFDGKPAVFGAMPVMPDAYNVTLPDGDPTILVSAQYIDDLLLAQLNSETNFASFKFVPSTDVRAEAPRYSIANQHGERLGSFTWESQTVAQTLWPTIIPVIVVLSAALGALAFGIAWRIGQLTSSLQASERQNRHLALHDSLSGLANRLQFNHVLETAIATLTTQPFAVLHCDLDKFKAVNDTYGHAAGDEVIKVMADRLTKTVGHDGIVCRVGGDEFMVIYQGDTDLPHLKSLGNALIAATCLPIKLPEGNTAHIGLSVGIAIAPEDGEEAELLVTRSDAALYHSKNMGRNRHTCYSDIAALEDEAVQLDNSMVGT